MIKIILQLLNNLFIPVASYFAGKKSEKNKRIKEENETLKKFEDINSNNVSSDDVYNDRMWK